MLATIAKGLGMARTIDYGNLMHRAMRSLIRSVFARRASFFHYL